MSLYSPLFKLRRRKAQPAAKNPQGTARIGSVLEDLARSINASPLDGNTKEKLEDELAGVIRARTAASFSRTSFWEALVEAVNEANIADHVVGNDSWETPDDADDEWEPSPLELGSGLQDNNED